jgi:signal transduction histidine kinase
MARLEHPNSMPMKISLSLKYIFAITVVLVIVLGSMSRLILKKQEEMVITQLHMQAKALFKQVVITRRWVADHGGVFVEKLPWVSPNPYLRNATITDVGGKKYIKENPAMVTKQLSRYAEREQLYMFHITSLKLMNPENAPDEFETASLKEFEKKIRGEASTVQKMSGGYYYRYIAPLFVEQACLSCHNKQGYKVGDVRGAISVSIPMDYARSMIATERSYMIAGIVAIGLLTMAALFLVTRRIVINPLRKIQAQMTRFSKNGELDAPLLLARDEIGDLHASFQSMASDIQEHHACLQQKISGATKELTEKNEALERSYRSKADFIAKTSHELRTPLTSIKGAMDYISVKLAMRDTDEDKDLLIFFEMIKKNADRMVRLLNNILDYERIELGTFEMQFREVNLKDVVQEVIAGLTPLAAEKQVAIRMKAMDVPAEVDADRIKQVLINLLSNALNFSPPLTKITVSLECRDETVRAAVEDQGTGVPDGELELIFKQFYTKGVKDGTGLGLAICKGIVEAHGGRIGVMMAESGGSRFWFEIPRQQKKEEKQDEKKTPCDR